MTLLQIIQAAVGELGLTVPTAVVSATDNQTMQFLALANMLGQGLVSDFEWQKICKTHTFTLDTDTQTGTTVSGLSTITGLSSTASLAVTVWSVSGSGIATPVEILSIDSASQVTMTQPATASGTVSITFTKTMYDLPSDWDRQINRTHWDRTNHWELIGPESAQVWGWLRGGIIATGPRLRYRILANKFQVWPLVVSESALAYDYVSNYWILASGGTAATKATFTADTDTCIFRDRLMINGIKLKFWEIKGFDTTSLKSAYDAERDKAMAQDKGAPTLSMAPSTNAVLISPANVPDGTVYGQTS